MELRLTFRSVTLCLAFIFCLVQNGELRDKEWYRTTSIYQVYTRSFKDSNGDGVGDLKGVHEKLDYIQSVGFETVWIQTFFKSPMKDSGYDISDFREVDPVFGTMEELKRLIKDIHDRGMKIIIDFVPNHTSDESEWFKKSVNKEEPYTDFYVWGNPKGQDPKTNLPVPPNNWISVFGGSMWEWNEKRNQFYLHQFSTAQPDLNYRSSAVKDAMKDVIRFWLDLGIDGFRVDAIVHLVEDASLTDNPWISPESVGKMEYWAQVHRFDAHQQVTYEITHEWRMVLDEYGQNGDSRIMTFEIWDDFDTTRKFFGNETYKNMHFPLNLMTLPLFPELSAKRASGIIRTWVETMPSVGVPSWLVSNHDMPRMASRCTPEFSLSAFMTVLLLPGVVSVYYGEEIRMEWLFLRRDQMTDSTLSFGFFSRDFVRTPMQWDDTPNAGFTDKGVLPWLPVNPNYWENNVKRQQEEPQSHLKTFTRLMELRKSAVIMDGQLETCAPTRWLLVFQRSLVNDSSVLVIVNMGTEMEVVSLKNCTIRAPQIMNVHTASLNSGFNSGDKIRVCKASESDCSELRPKAGLVLTLAANTSGRSSVTSLHSCLVSIFSVIIPIILKWQP